MSLLNNPDKAAEEEEEKEEDKTQEEQPEVIEDDLIKTPGMSLLSKISLNPQTMPCLPIYLNYTTYMYMYRSPKHPHAKH